VLHQKLDVDEITAVLRTRRLRWYGHVQRATSCINSITRLGVPGTRNRGRPRKTWSACVRNDMTIMQPGWCQPVRQEFMENECEALPGVAYPGVRDNRSNINTKTGYDDDDDGWLAYQLQNNQDETTTLTLTQYMDGTVRLPYWWCHSLDDTAVTMYQLFHWAESSLHIVVIAHYSNSCDIYVWCVSVFQSPALIACIQNARVLLLLIQCMHAVCSTFRVTVSVRFCFSVGIVVRISF